MMNIKKLDWYWRQGGGAVLPDDVVLVLFSMGQSNAGGRAEADRLKIKTWPIRPINSYYYVKTAIDAVDNGAFRSMWIGGPNYEEPDETARRLFAEDAILTSKFRALFGDNTPIYSINAAEGGTFLVDNAELNRHWLEATAECWDRAFDAMYIPAIADIEAAHPTKTIKVIKIWHQGESEAVQGGANVTNYPSALATFDASVSAVDAYLAAAPWLITKLWYNEDANEATINGYLDAFVAAGSGRYVIDISSYPQKDGLTVEEKAGVTPTGTDDQHQSYLAQIAKADLHYPSVLTFYNWPNNVITPITENDEFDSSTYISGVKKSFRYQMNGGNMTITPGGGTAGDENKVTALTDSFGNYSSLTFAGTSPRHKVQGRKGCLEWPLAASNGDTRIILPVASSNAIFNGGGFVWTIGGKVKTYPNSGSGGHSAICLLSTTDVYTGTRSSILVYTSSMKLRIDVRCNSSTAKSAMTNVAAFENTVNEGDQFFIHWAITSDGSNMKIFIDGVEVALDATANGSLSGITPGDFNNATNGIVIGQRQTAESTFDFGFIGEQREVFALAGVALTAEQIQNVMLN